MKGSLNAFKFNGCITYNVKNTDPLNADCYTATDATSPPKKEQNEKSETLTWQSKSWKLRAFCKKLKKRKKKKKRTQLTELIYSRLIT